MISKGEMCAFKLLILVFTNAVFHVTFSYSVGCVGGGGGRRRRGMGFRSSRFLQSFHPSSLYLPTPAFVCLPPVACY